MDMGGQITADLLGKFNRIDIATGTDKDIVKAASSGGVITSLLVCALELGLADAAVVVTNKTPGFRPKMILAQSRKEIFDATGSKYVYMTFADLKRVLDSTKKRLIVVAQPCHIETLRKMMGNKKYRNISFLIGFFCGYNQSWAATEYLVRKSRIRKKDISKIDYRGGEYPGGFFVKSKSGRSVLFPKHYYDFVNLMFVPKQCLNCRRYMAEFADIAVGDAWLANVKNHSSVVVRTAAGKKLYEQAIKKKYLKSRSLAKSKLMKMHMHNLKHKKIGDSFFMSLATKVLNNRIAPRIMPFALLGLLAKIRRRFKKKLMY